jgi:hypothetical protein
MFGLMRRDLVVAGKAISGAGLTGAVLYLVATVPTHMHVYWPYWLFAAAVVVGVGLYFAGQERSPAAIRMMHWHRRPADVTAATMNDHGRRDRAWSGCSLSTRGWTSTCARSRVAVRR